MRDQSSWKMRGYRARLTKPGLSASVDLLQPQQGLLDVQVSGVLLTRCQVLQVVPAGYPESLPPESLVDVYTRGPDLIATYAESGQAHVRPQIYWRDLGGSSALGGIELILSAQTSQLQSEPGMWAQMRWSDAAAWRLVDLEREEFEALPTAAPFDRRLDAASGTSLVLLQPAYLRFSVAMAVFPSDFQYMMLRATERPDGQQIRCWLFPESLEKGVIRRGRVRTWFFAREGDTTAACQAMREFLDAPLPLTT